MRQGQDSAAKRLRFGSLDRTATAEARGDGRFTDRRSVMLRRMDGSYRIVLFGEDKKRLRHRVFERDKGCVDRAKSDCHGPLQMSHFPPMSKSEGSDEIDKVSVRCWKHHILLDGHGQPMHF